MNVLLLPASLVLAAAVLAQEHQRDVPPGREFRDTKVLTPGQTDVWKVDARADEVLKCRVSASDLDPVLDLVDERGQVLASADGEGSRSYVQWRVSKPGTVQFRVRGYRGGGGGRYDFGLERYMAPPLAVGAETAGEFGPEQWWHVRLELEAGECFVPVVEGARLVAVMQFTKGANVGENLGAYTAMEGGEYHLRIEGSERQRFRLRTRRPMHREAAGGLIVAATVEPFGLDIVHVRMPAAAASMLDLAMPGVQLLQWHRLLGKDPAWRELGNVMKGGASRRLFQPERDLDLELWLRNPADAPAPYTCRGAVADLPLAAGPTTAGTLPLGDLRCHVLRASAGEVVSVHLLAEAFDAAMAVCAPDGSTIASVDDAGPLERNPEVTFCAPRTGDYRIIAHAAGHSGSGAYRIDVARHEVPVLGFDRGLDLRVEPGRDAHARLQLAAGQEVYLSARSGDCDVALSIDDDEGRRHGTWEGGGFDGNALVAFRAAKAGTFTVFVHSRRGAGACRLQALAAE